MILILLCSSSLLHFLHHLLLPSQPLPDKWIVNPARKSEKSLPEYEFIGRILGASIHTQSSIELDLVPHVWKFLLGQEPTLDDILDIDERFRASWMAANAAESLSEWEAMGREWKVRDWSTGSTLSLSGESGPVKFEDRNRFLGAWKAFRLSDEQLAVKQMEAMRQGFLTCVPSDVLPFMEWLDVCQRCCGSPTISVEELQNITNYQGFTSEHPVALMFWNVVQNFSNAERHLLLLFTWGQGRMPPSVGGIHMKLTLREDASDEHLPTSHTCFFALDLPMYTKESIMREKLLYAIQFCKAIDTDVRATGNLLSAISREESAMEEPNVLDTDNPASDAEPPSLARLRSQQPVVLHTSEHTVDTIYNKESDRVVWCFPAHAPRFVCRSDDIELARRLLEEAHCAGNHNVQMCEFSQGQLASSNMSAWSSSSVSGSLDKRATVEIDGSQLELLWVSTSQLYTWWNDAPQYFPSSFNLRPPTFSANSFKLQRGGNSCHVSSAFPISNGRHAFEYVAYSGLELGGTLICGFTVQANCGTPDMSRHKAYTYVTSNNGGHRISAFAFPELDSDDKIARHQDGSIRVTLAECHTKAGLAVVGFILDFDKRIISFFLNRKLVTSCVVPQEIDKLYLIARVLSKCSEDYRIELLPWDGQATCDPAVQRLYGDTPLWIQIPQHHRAPNPQGAGETQFARFLDGPLQSLSQRGCCVVHKGSSSFACHVVRPSLLNVKKATITFRVITGPQASSWGSNGIYLGLTTCEHEIKDGQAACGAPSSYMYRCRDGWRWVRGEWSEHSTHTGSRQARIGTTGYYAVEAGNPACRTIILEFVRNEVVNCGDSTSEMAAGVTCSLTVYDQEDGRERRLCGEGPLAVGISAEKEFFFCLDTYESGQGAKILSFVVDGIEMLAPPLPYSRLPSVVTWL